MSRLGELGLSSYEEQVYRALLSLGVATAQDVAGASGVPRGRIYDVLNGLEARELLRARPDEPTRYEAVEPEVAVERLLAERRRELDARGEHYERLAAELGPELAATAPTESRFWTAPLGSEAATTLVGEVFESAGESVRSAMSRPYEAAAWERYEAEVDPFFDALDERLTVKTLVTATMLDGVPPDVKRSYLDPPCGVELRVTTDLEVSFDLVDGATVCFHVAHPTEAGERLGVIELRDGSLAGRLAELFEDAWSAAVPLADVVDADGGSSVR